jgi:hypothetical protein
VLKLTKGWDAAKEHAMQAVTSDHQLRIWSLDSTAGLLFKCHMGVVDIEKPVGESLLQPARCAARGACASHCCRSLRSLSLSLCFLLDCRSHGVTFNSGRHFFLLEVASFMDVIVCATADIEGADFCTAGVKTDDTMHQNASSALIHMRHNLCCTLRGGD